MYEVHKDDKTSKDPESGIVDLRRSSVPKSTASISKEMILNRNFGDQYSSGLADRLGKVVNLDLVYDTLTKADLIDIIKEQR